MDKKFLRYGISNLYTKIALKLNRPVYDIIGSEGEDFISQDWDNLILLDACRYDWFKDMNPIDGKLTKKTSMASESWEFMQKNFMNRSLHDTVYITANPHSNKLPRNTFFAIINLLDTHWSEEKRTVLPSDMVEKTIQVHKEYPNKRLIAHFMQPHYPFIGESGHDINHQGITPMAEMSKQGMNPWSILNNYSADEDRENILMAYRENHEIALDNAEKLVKSLPGKTVVSSDHSNLIGELVLPIPKKLYGHPRHFRKSELTTVPWLEVKSGDRRTIESGTPIQNPLLDKDMVKSRLRDLGYT